MPPRRTSSSTRARTVSGARRPSAAPRPVALSPDAAVLEASWMRSVLLHLHRASTGKPGTAALSPGHPTGAAQMYPAALEPVLRSRRRRAASLPAGGLRSPSLCGEGSMCAEEAQVLRTEEPLVDTAPVAPERTFHLDAKDAPQTGKYVFDPTDPEGLKTKKGKRMLAAAKAAGRAAGLSAAAAARLARPGRGGSDDDSEDDEAFASRPPPPQLTPEELNATLDVPVVASIFEACEGGLPADAPAVSTMFFPIAYPPPSKKDDTAMKRAPPEAINAALHGAWPPPPGAAAEESPIAAVGAPPAMAPGAIIPPPPGSAALGALPWQRRPGMAAPQSLAVRTLRLKKHAADTVPLFRVGPGAVAFRVVLQAFEAAGMRSTAGWCHDAKDSHAPHPPCPAQFVAPPGTASTATSWNVLWAKRADPATLAALGPYQKLNHFPGAWGIGRKDNLHKSVQRLRTMHGGSHYDIVPRTFLFPQEREALEADCAAQQQAHPENKVPTYISKPVASSCGKGIKVIQGIPAASKPKSDGSVRSVIVQRYVDPFLIDGRKFDLRMYCVVTGVDPLRIWLFDQGLVRFAAERYPGPDALLENSFMHLTNYAVNKTAQLRKESASRGVDGDEPVDIKWMLSDLHDHFLCTTVDTIPAPSQVVVTAAAKASGQSPPPLNAVRQEQWARMMKEVKDVVVKTVLSVETEVGQQVRAQCQGNPTGRGCFELFGLDLMLDSALKPHLIEVNIMASLATAEAVDKAVKARVLAHLLTLVGPVAVNRQTVEQERVLRQQRDAEEKAADSATFAYSRAFLLKQRKALDAELKALRSKAGAAPATPSDATSDTCPEEDLAAPSTPAAAPKAGLGKEKEPKEAKEKEVAALRDIPMPSYASDRALQQLASAKRRVPASLDVGGVTAKPGQPAAGPLSLTAADVQMLVECEEEFNRRGGFERVFPRPGSDVDYFPIWGGGLRRNNVILAAWEATKERLAAAAAGTAADAPAAASVAPIPVPPRRVVS